MGIPSPLMRIACHVAWGGSTCQWGPMAGRVADGVARGPTAVCYLPWLGDACTLERDRVPIEVLKRGLEAEERRTQWNGELHREGCHVARGV